MLVFFLSNNSPITCNIITIYAVTALKLNSLDSTYLKKKIDSLYIILVYVELGIGRQRNKTRAGN